MFYSFTRLNMQIISFSFVCIGIYLITFGISATTGATFVGLSCWIMLISESILLTKVQNEMTVSLESLRKKQEIDIQELLFYLRQSELGNNPWANIDAAKNYIKKIKFPALITDSGGACIAINKAFADNLGYNKDIVGSLCHALHDKNTYGEYVQGIQERIECGQRFIHSRLTMFDINGKAHAGTAEIILLPDMRTAVGIWLPDSAGVLKSI